MRKARVPHLLLEGVIVLAGVFLALLADEWREERQLDQEAHAARLLLEDEIVANHAILADFRFDVVDRYQRIRALRDQLQSELSFDAYSGCFIGYRFAQFRSAAWQRASRDRIGSRLDARYMDAAAGLYSWNDTLDSLGVPLNRLIYSPGYFDAEFTQVNWRLAERLIWQQQRWAEVMLSEYRHFVESFVPEQLERLDQEVVAAQERWVAAEGRRTELIAKANPRCGVPIATLE